MGCGIGKQGVSPGTHLAADALLVDEASDDLQEGGLTRAAGAKDLRYTERACLTGDGEE